MTIYGEVGLNELWLFQRLLLNYERFDRVPSIESVVKYRSSGACQRKYKLFVIVYSSRRFSSFYGYSSYAVMDNLSLPPQVRL
jgi:hypothetical protein